MILPTKHLSDDRSLLRVGGEILRLLTEPKTVSRLWNELSDLRGKMQLQRVTYDWFILALDLLFSMSVIEFKSGRIWRAN